MIQPVLCGGNSTATDLSVFLDSSESTYEVYIGVALLERIDVSPDDLKYKMLVGRLYNAGLKRRDLREAFGHDNRTMKKWGDALKSEDIEEMVRAFAGRSARKKVTPELVRYARQLYRSRAVLGRNYREVIIQRIAEVFQVSISPSLASELFKGAEPPAAPARAVGAAAEELEICEQSPGNPASDSGSSVQKSPIFPFMTDILSAGPRAVLLRHVGLVLFGLWVRLYSSTRKQFVFQLLQGAVNVEQSKTLCHRSLGYFCERPVSSLNGQREILDAEASRESVLELYRLNASLLADGPNRGDLFYFDPHTKEYVGQLKILKGWCGRRHGIAKVVNLDCFHTRSGRPCFIQHYDAFHDMRERFFMGLSQFDLLFDEDKRQGRTFVIDRAIYSLPVLRSFVLDHVITWEKNYDGGGWDDGARTIRFTKARRRNRESDLRFYEFECQESPWSRDGTFRRIIVKVRRDGADEITVSVLCSNPDMDVQDVVWAIFNRWLQENDFKYLDVQLGINQLDSRARSNYAEKPESFRDRLVDSPEYQRLKKTLRNTESRLARNLLTLRRKLKSLGDLRLEAANLTMKLSKRRQTLKGAKGTNREKSDPLLKQLAKKKRRTNVKIKNAEEKADQLNGKSLAMENEIMDLTEQLNRQVRKESRLRLLIDACYQTLDLRRKAYMDALRINAANLFKSLHERFRSICDNYRDDHVKLRMLTQCDGFIVNDTDKFIVSLWLPGSVQPHVIGNMRTFVKEMENEINRIISADGEPKRLAIEIITGPIPTAHA